MDIITRWFRATCSNHILVSICCRDTDLSRKDENGDEIYTTPSRMILALYYIIALLCFNVTVALIVASIDSDCEITTYCKQNCMKLQMELSDSTVCLPATSTVGPYSIKVTDHTKNAAFRLMLLPTQFYVYNMNQLNLNTTESSNSYVSDFDYCKKSHSCYNDPNSMSDTQIVCLEPKYYCMMKTTVPTSFDPNAIRQYILVKLALAAVTTLALYVLVTPMSWILTALYNGYCRPKYGYKRSAYQVGVIVCSLIAILLLVIWLAVCVTSLLVFFNNVTLRSKLYILFTTFVMWIISITILEFIYGGIYACLFSPRFVCCGSTNKETW
jgi:hypothetical protein